MPKKAIKPIEELTPVIEVLPNVAINGMPNSPEKFLSTVKRYLTEHNDKDPNPKDFLDFYLFEIAATHPPVTREEFIMCVDNYIQDCENKRIAKEEHHPTFAEFFLINNFNNRHLMGVFKENYPEPYFKMIMYIEHRNLNRGGKDTGISCFTLKNIKDANFGEGYKDKTEHNLNVIPVQFVGEERLLD